MELNNRRTKIAVALANFILRALASKSYQLYLSGAIEYGLRSAVRDGLEGREPPPDWRKHD